jgi:uncharacterized protein YraI
MTNVRLLVCLVLASSGLARADPEPAPTSAGARSGPTLPSRGFVACTECGGVVLEGVAVRAGPGQAPPRCGVVTSGAELWSEPGADASLRTTLPPGAPVGLAPAPVAGWLRVRAGSGTEGYVAQASVTAGPSEACRELAATPVAMRSGPDPKAAVRGELQPDAPVTFGPAPVKGWLRVRGAGGESGYVLARNVRAEDGTLAPASPEARRERIGLASLRLGMAIPTHDELSGWENGPAFELTLALWLSDFARLEASVGRSTVSADGDFETAQGDTFALEASLHVLPVLAGLRVVLPVGRAELSALVGAGLGFVSWDGTATTPVASGTASGDDSTFLTQAGLGLAAPISARTRLELEARLLMGEAKVLEVETGLNTVLVTAGLGWEF